MSRFPVSRERTTPQKKVLIDPLINCPRCVLFDIARPEHISRVNFDSNWSSMSSLSVYTQRKGRKCASMRFMTSVRHPHTWFYQPSLGALFTHNIVWDTTFCAQVYLVIIPLFAGYLWVVSTFRIWTRHSVRRCSCVWGVTKSWIQLSKSSTLRKYRGWEN